MSNARARAATLEQPAFVLHRQSYSETSLLIDCLTQDQGRIRCLAQGAKRYKSSLNQCLHPFSLVTLSYQDRPALKKIIQVEPSHPLMYLNGERLIGGIYINELITRLIPQDDPHPTLFSLYQKTIQQLTSDHSLESILRPFELEFLAILGYGLPDAIPTLGSAIRYDPDQGWLACLATDQRAFAKEHIAMILTGEFKAPEVLATAKRLTRSILQPLLGKRPLQARKLFPPKGPRTHPAHSDTVNT